MVPWVILKQLTLLISVSSLNKNVVNMTSAINERGESKYAETILIADEQTYISSIFEICEATFFLF